MTTNDVVFAAGLTVWAVLAVRDWRQKRAAVRDAERAHDAAVAVRDPDEPALRAWYDGVSIPDLAKCDPNDPTKGPTE